MEQNAQIAIIGAGISALTVAYELKRNGYNAIVLNPAKKVGGAVQTGSENGFTYEFGPNSLLKTTDYIASIIQDLGLSDEMITAKPTAKNRFIVKNGKLEALPLSPLALLKTSLFSAKAKWRLMREPFITSKAEENETVAAFVRRRLGDEFLDYAINPFVVGVYAGDPEKLSLRYAFKKLLELEERYGSLIKGQIKGAKERKKRGEVAKDRAPMISFKKGLYQLIEALEAALNSQIISNIEIEAIHTVHDGWSISLKNTHKTIDVNVLLPMIPAFALEKLPFSSLKQDNRKWLTEIYYPPVTVVHSGFNRNTIAHPLQGFGYLTPQVEHRNVLGTLFASEIFEHRAPENHTLLTSFIGGARQPQQAERSDEELKKLIADEYRELLGITTQPVFTKLIRWQRAIPQYEGNHGVFLAKVEEMEKVNNGLFFGGNWLHGISMSDCINQAKPMADRVLAYMESLRLRQ